MVSRKRRRSGDSWEINSFLRTEELWILHASVDDGGQERAYGVEGDSLDAESGGELVSPAEEEIGDECDWGVGVVCEPFDDWVLEIGEGVYEGVVSDVADFTDVFCTRGDVWV